MTDINILKLKINSIIKYLNFDYLINYIYEIFNLISYQDNEKYKKFNYNTQIISDLENQLDNRNNEQIEDKSKLISIQIINNISSKKKYKNN